MAQPFSFPPPPPPPPRTESLQHSSSAHPNYPSSYGNGTRDRENGDNRGGGRGNAFRGRGFSSRGQGFSDRGRGARGTYGGAYGTRSFNHNSNSFRQTSGRLQGPRQDAQNPPRSFSPPYQGPKRPYSTAFNKPATSMPRPQASPAVPSFGGDILRPLMPQTISAPASKKKPRKHNQLGLTPASQDHESSSDEDEEAKLANHIPSGTQSNTALLQFEYKGRTATLQTAADIAAWIAERKKNFPTAAKAEVAKREAEEKGRKWEAGKRERGEVLRLQRLEQEKVRQEELRKRALESLGPKKGKKEDIQDVTRQKKEEDSVTKAAKKMEKLKRKLEKAQSDARRAEEALARMQHGNKTIEKDGSKSSGSLELPSKSPVVGTLATPPSETHEPQPRPVDELAKLKAELLNDEDVDGASSNASVTSSDIEDDDATSSSGSSSTPEPDPASESEPDTDSASDSPPDKITSKRTAPDRVLPPPRIDPSSKPSHAMDENKNPRPRNPCRNMLRTGRCQFGSRCRYSHDLSSSKNSPGGGRDEGGVEDRRGGDAAAARVREGKSQGQSRGQGKEKTIGRIKTERKGLFRIMVEKEVEEERRAVMGVIMEMGERGLLGESETEIREDHD